MKKKEKTDFDKVKAILNGKTTYSLLEDSTSKLKEIVNKEILFMINNQNSCASCSFDHDGNIIYISLMKKSFSDELHCINNWYNHINVYENTITDKFDKFFDTILKEVIFYEPERHAFNFIKSIGLNNKKDFMEYVKYDNINAHIVTGDYSDDCMGVVVFNRFDIPIELIYIDNILVEILILRKNSKSLDFNKLNISTDCQPIPSILVSSFMNYFLKK